MKKSTTEKKTVTKKTTKAEETVKAVEPVKEEVKVAEVKEEVKAAEKKTAEKKTATKTTKATKATKSAKTTSEKITLQVNGREDLAMDSLIERVKAAYVEEGNKADSIENIEVYIKLEENMAYYVIDGYASGISLY